MRRQNPPIPGSVGIAWALVHMQDWARNEPHPDLLRDDARATDGVRASGRPHPIQDRYADGCLSLLLGEATRS